MLTKVGRKKKKRKAFTTNNLEKFPQFFGFIFPRTETPQNNTTSAHSIPAQSGSAEVHKHFLFHFFLQEGDQHFLSLPKSFRFGIHFG